MNVCSIGGLDPIPYQVPYTTSKFAVAGLTKALRAELKPQGIHVCGIYPSFIRTRLMERGHFRGYSEETAAARRDFVNAMFHTGLLEPPENVAEAIWKGVTQQKADVVVGTAKFWTTAYHLFPGLMKPIFRRTFGMGEHVKVKPEQQ